MGVKTAPSQAVYVGVPSARGQECVLLDELFILHVCIIFGDNWVLEQSVTFTT